MAFGTPSFPWPPEFIFDTNKKLIVVKAPTTDVTCQEILNASRDWLDEIVNMHEANFIRAYGNDDLGGGVYTGITIELIGWKMRFETGGGAITSGTLVELWPETTTTTDPEREHMESILRAWSD